MKNILKILISISLTAQLIFSDVNMNVGTSHGFSHFPQEQIQIPTIFRLNKNQLKKIMRQYIAQSPLEDSVIDKNVFEIIKAWNHVTKDFSNDAEIATFLKEIREYLYRSEIFFRNRVKYYEAVERLAKEKTEAPVPFERKWGFYSVSLLLGFRGINEKSDLKPFEPSLNGIVKKIKIDLPFMESGLLQVEQMHISVINPYALKPESFFTTEGLADRRKNYRKIMEIARKYLDRDPENPLKIKFTELMLTPHGSLIVKGFCSDNRLDEMRYELMDELDIEGRKAVNFVHITFGRLKQRITDEQWQNLKDWVDTFNKQHNGYFGEITAKNPVIMVATENEGIICHQPAMQEIKDSQSFDSYEGIAELVKQRRLASLIPERKIIKNDFSELVELARKEYGLETTEEELWNEAVEQGYIDEDGKIKDKFKNIITGDISVGEVKGVVIQNMIISPKFEKIKVEIFNVIRQGQSLDDLFQYLEVLKQENVFQGNVKGHILQTIKNVDEIVDKMVGDGEIPRDKARQFKYKARMVMLFHDVGDVFAEADDKLWQRHESLSAIYFKPFLKSMGFSEDEISQYEFFMLHHGTLGVLGGEQTDRSEGVSDFISSFKSVEDVLMLKIIALCDVSNRHWYLSGKSNLKKIEQISQLLYAVISNPKDIQARTRLEEYLKDKDSFRRLVFDIKEWQGMYWAKKMVLVDFFMEFFNIFEKKFDGINMSKVQLFLNAA